jgi:hypothetical protein
LYILYIHIILYIYTYYIQYVYKSPHCCCWTFPSHETRRVTLDTARLRHCAPRTTQNLESSPVGLESNIAWDPETSPWGGTIYAISIIYDIIWYYMILYIWYYMISYVSSSWNRYIRIWNFERYSNFCDDYWEYSLFHLLQDDQRFISAYTWYTYDHA